MAEDAPRGDGRHIAFQDVQVGSADRHQVDADDRIGVVDDAWVWYLLPCLLAWAVVDECLHDGPLSSGLNFAEPLRPPAFSANDLPESGRFPEPGRSKATHPFPGPAGPRPVGRERRPTRCRAQF